MFIMVEIFLFEVKYVSVITSDYLKSGIEFTCPFLKKFKNTHTIMLNLFRFIFLSL